MNDMTMPKTAKAAPITTESLGTITEAEILALPHRFRDLMTLAISGKKYHEIADEKRLPIGTVRSRLSRAKGHILKRRALPTADQLKAEAARCLELDKKSWDSEETIDACNAFGEQAERILPKRDMDRLIGWSLKATQREIVEETLRLLLEFLDQKL